VVGAISVSMSFAPLDRRVAADASVVAPVEAGANATQPSLPAAAPAFFPPVALRLSFADGDPLVEPPADNPLDGGAILSIEKGMDKLSVVGQWSSLIEEASDRFGVPKSWIRAVMLRESGGHTLSATGRPIRSRKGAMGLMQLMPDTYADLRRQYGLGDDPYDPHDNVIAGAAYLKWLRERYGYPALFAAYNHGPGNYEKHLHDKSVLPQETRAYVAAVTATVGRSRRAAHANEAIGLRMATL